MGEKCHTMFGKKKVPPQEQAKEWKNGIRGQKRGIERQIRHLEMEETRMKQRITTLIRQGQGDAAIPIVKSLALSRKTRSNLLKTCTQLDSLVRQVDLQITQLKVTGCFKESADITHMMNQMVRVPEMQETMARLAMEMEHAGLAGEMIGEAMDQIGPQGEPEDEDLAVRLVYNEIAGEINRTAKTPVALIPVDPGEVAADPAAAKLAAG
jgi:charged multivesicular body protein 3